MACTLGFMQLARVLNLAVTWSVQDYLQRKALNYSMHAIVQHPPIRVGPTPSSSCPLSARNRVAGACQPACTRCDRNAGICHAVDGAHSILHAVPAALSAQVADCRKTASLVSERLPVSCVFFFPFVSSDHGLHRAQFVPTVRGMPKQDFESVCRSLRAATGKQRCPDVPITKPAEGLRIILDLPQTHCIGIATESSAVHSDIEQEGTHDGTPTASNKCEQTEPVKGSCAQQRQCVIGTGVSHTV